MSVLLIRRRRPIGEPGEASRPNHGHAGSPIVDTLDGTAGAGRISAALLDLGVDLRRLRQAVIEPEASLDDLDAIDLGRQFDLVVLGSHLVNHPQADRRAAFLGIAARHAGPHGSVLVEHHPVDWAETAEPTPATPGADVGMEDVRRHPPFVSAVSMFDIGGHEIRQPFTARVLSEAELAEALHDVGLRVRQRLGPTFLEAARPTVAD